MFKFEFVPTQSFGVAEIPEHALIAAALCLKDGNKIRAIKIVRQSVSDPRFGLKAAKDFVEQQVQDMLEGAVDLLDDEYSRRMRQ